MEDKKAYLAAWRLANAERIRENARVWARANPEKIKAHRDQTYQNHRDSRIERVANYQQSEDGRRVHAKANRRWRERNPHKVAKLNAKHCIARAEGLPPEVIPEELIDAKVNQLAVRRAIKERG